MSLFLDCFDYNFSAKNDWKYIRDEKSGLDIFIKTINDTDIISILGSNEFIDWETNISFFLKKYKRPDYADKNSKIKVHSGYFNAWMRVRDETLFYIKSDKVIVTGFSMGGGVSSIIAVDIQYNKNPKELICVDFEGAKVWNKAGMISFNKRVTNSFKIKNGNDFVTKLPFFYYFVGKKIHIGNKEHWWKFSIKDHTDYLFNNQKIRELISKI